MSLLREYIREILIEHEEEALPKGDWVLLQPGDPRRDRVKDEVFDIVQSSYADLGGHFKIGSPGDLDQYTYWAVVDLDEDPEVDAGILGKSKGGGAKMSVVASDGSGPGAAAAKDTPASLASGGSLGGVGGWWGEMSDKMAYAVIKRGGPALEDEARVRQLVGDDIVWHGEHPDPNAPAVFKSVKGWYSRSIGGHEATKVIIGSPG
jgi:hypothetical protein